jgi:hypothetical protein
LGTVIIEWECLKLSQFNGERYVFRVPKEALFVEKMGWICNCGRWTTGDDRLHIPRIKGIREVYKSVKKKNYDYNNIIN